MSGAGLSLSRVRSVLQLGVASGAAAPSHIARALYCSESTLHRTFRRHGTTFAAERNQIRVASALALLQDGLAPNRVARRVGVTPDYLRLLVVATVGMTPVQIAHVAALGVRLNRPPASFEELEHRPMADAELQRLVGDIPAGHPLATGGKKMVVDAFHPEFETVEFWESLRARYRAHRAELRDRLDAEWAATDNDVPTDHSRSDPQTALEEHVDDVVRSVSHEIGRARLRAMNRARPKTSQ
jgi:AraC-like DNA-binding protein